MRAVVFGTSGHIDHGKTSLVLALTGVDCDRLPEEKRRGITLVLGFAPLADPAGELEVSFIDVPGHERLVHTMIAGAGGIDRALLVIAADEGVMPQTREHLDVLDLLGVRGGVVALNKADLLDDDLLAVRIREVREALAGGPLAEAPIVPCSAVRGTGVEDLRRVVLACAREVKRDEERHRPFRIAVDRVFTMPGSGTVITGTARWGAVKPGDELSAVPSEMRLRVRAVQVHGHSRDEGRAGERIALSLAGASVDEVPRGEQLLGAGPWRAADRLAVRVRVLPDAAGLVEGDQVWVHLLAARSLGRVVRLHPERLEGGAQGWAVLRLGRPVFAAPGDRLVLRRVSPARTVAGGTVLDPNPPRLRHKEAAALAHLPDPRTDLPAAIVAWTRGAGPAGISVPELSARLGVTAEGLEAPLGGLVGSRDVQLANTRPPVLVAREQVEAARERARAVLGGAGGLGLPLAELVARVVVPEAVRLKEFLLSDLRRAGLFREVAGRAMTGSGNSVEEELAGRLESLYREARFDAPSPEEAALRLGASAKVVEGVIRYLLDRRRLARVGGKWVLSRGLLDEVADSLRAWGVERFDVGQFKDRFSLTRKLAIPILEWLDSERVTRREGEHRRVLPRRAGTNSGG
ncbi:MAG: selenocysteine-specific translation elongation factor [Acidobacteriota bacterium]